jgi:transcriptional regulator with XRE-family HTH domain
MVNSIGDTLKKVRELKGIYLQLVADKTGINISILSRIENHKRMPTREQVILLSRFYKEEENDIIIAWLSDKIVNEMQNESLALQAMQVAEEKIKYITKFKK